MAKKYRINRELNIGSPDAETDELLFDAFIKNQNYRELTDVKSQKSILIGRTGSGKSAILKYLETNVENVHRIEPESLSLRFLSNSTILKYFRGLEINLNFFFKVLWKHVFIVELLKLYFKDDFDRDRQKRWVENFKDSMKRNFGRVDPRKEKAFKYLDTWTDKFWLDTEYRVKELEKNISEKFSSKLGSEFAPFQAGVNTEDTENHRALTEIKHKAESVIHESLPNELIDIIQMMKEGLFTDFQKKFYIIIDDLDKEWIEADFRYDLIGALIEVIKEFRQFKGVKIAISLRENLDELLKLGSKHEGGQREKFKPLYSKMTWEKQELLNLIDARLKIVTHNNLTMANAFYSVRRKNNEQGVDYALRRTYMRPRDIISFINHAIENANSKTHFTNDILYKAESSYSAERFEALEDEWRENYGEIYPICKFLNGISDGFSLKSLNLDHFEEVYLADANDFKFKGTLKDIITDFREERINDKAFFKRMIFLLYHIGIIGIKKTPQFPVAFFFDQTIIRKDDISTSNKYYVHPSLYSYFKVNTLEQLPEESIS